MARADRLVPVVPLTHSQSDHSGESLEMGHAHLLVRHQSLRGEMPEGAKDPLVHGETRSKSYLILRRT